jgi:predicted phosphodiesterase
MLRRAGHRYFAVALVAGAASLFATALIPPAHRTVGPAEVSIETSLGGGRTALEVPPLGTVSAATHAPPLSLNVTLSKLDLQDLGQRFSQGSREELIDEIETGLRATALGVAVQQVLGAAIVGAVVAALVAGRKLDYLLVGAASGALVIALALLLASVSFDVNRFEDARYTGALEFAPQVMDAVNRTPEAIDDLNSRFAVAADRLTELMALVAQPLPDPHEGTTAILHVSDIHSNPVGVQIARSLALDFEVDAVIDTGDLTSFGQPVESRIGRLLAGIPVPYVFVPGNHDSSSNRVEIARVDGVELLDKRTFSIDGIDVLGWADPTFTASNETSTDEGNEAREAEAPEVAAEVERLQPDILATHDQRLAVDAIGDVPLVLAGHTHGREFEQEDGTLLLTVGSTGATGLGTFIVESEQPYEAEVVYFRDDVPVAVDYISLSGLGGDFEVERRTVDTNENGDGPSPSVETTD